MADFRDLQNAISETDRQLALLKLAHNKVIALAIREASIRLEVALREHRNSGVGDKRFG